MAGAEGTLSYLLTLTLVYLTTALQEDCPTSWAGGAQLGVPRYFYPFNPGTDPMVPEGDDTNSPRLTLATVFPFYGQFFAYMYVSTNGALYFADPPTWFPAGGMPLKNVPLIGPLYVDTDSSMSEGRVYYQATTERDILCRFSAYVRDKRLDALNFKATWALIATWHNLTFYKGNSSHPVNTFQVVIATDGQSSFALFNYGELNWSIGPEIIHAQVGFNSGFGDNHYEIPESGTNITANLHNLTGNTRERGQWLFRINKEIINGHGSEGLVASFPVEEKGPISMTCPSADLDYVSRFWLRGSFGSDSTLLFSQTNSSMEISHFSNRDDMSINNSTFELSIGEAALEDGTYFTCKVLYGTPLRIVFDNVELRVYVQPELIMTGLEVTTLTLNTTVKVSCMIPRLAPAIGPDAFKLLWGESSAVEEHKTNKNPDTSYQYIITRTETLTLEDNGKVVTCSVVPLRGKKVTVSRTLTVLTLSDVEVTSGSKMRHVAVIAGAAGGVLLLVVFIIIVFAMSCSRKKIKHSNTGHTTEHKLAMDNLGYNQGRGPDQYDVKGGDRPPVAVPDDLYEEITDARYTAGLGNQSSRQKIPANKYKENPYLIPVPTFEEWARFHQISPNVEAVLRQQQVTTTEDLRRMTDEDVKELGLVVWERNRLIEALSALKQY